jgi:hypothetical protein
VDYSSEGAGREVRCVVGRLTGLPIWWAGAKVQSFRPRPVMKKSPSWMISPTDMRRMAWRFAKNSRFAARVPLKDRQAFRTFLSRSLRAMICSSVSTESLEQRPAGLSVGKPSLLKLDYLAVLPARIGVVTGIAGSHVPHARDLDLWFVGGHEKPGEVRTRPGSGGFTPH